VKFTVILYEFVGHTWSANESDIILGVLSLIDISLSGNLVLIIIFAGYENLVSRIDAASHPVLRNLRFLRDTGTGARQITHGFMPLVRHPHRCEFARP
jgi:uncharacterized protein (TIGR00645 family)